jgi:hypothetical protein
MYAVRPTKPSTDAPHRPRQRRPRPVSLPDRQLQAVTLAASPLPLQKRGEFLARVITQLKLAGRFNDGDVDQAVQLALRGLLHAPC